MSQENVEVVRLIFDRWAEGDFQAGRELLHPDIEWVISREHPDARTLIGHEAVADYRREWQTVVPNMRLELDQVLDGGDKVVTIGAAHGTGTGSGADVRVPIAFVFTLRDGLIARAEEYLDPDEALEAVGLALVLAFHAAYNARELDAAVDLCAADVNVFPDASVFPESSSLVGRDELRHLLEETWAAWASGEVTPREVLDIGDGRVLVRADWGGTGSASGVETHTNLSAIYTIRDGHISGAEWFFDHGKALRAAGLSE